MYVGSFSALQKFGDVSRVASNRGLRNAKAPSGLARLQIDRRYGRPAAGAFPFKRQVRQRQADRQPLGRIEIRDGQRQRRIDHVPMIAHRPKPSGKLAVAVDQPNLLPVLLDFPVPPRERRMGTFEARFIGTSRGFVYV
jgi:hypothetical protein